MINTNLGGGWKKCNIDALTPIARRLADLGMQSYVMEYTTSGVKNVEVSLMDLGLFFVLFHKKMILKSFTIMLMLQCLKCKIIY